MDFGLQNKVIVITSGYPLIAAAIKEVLNIEGAQVIITGVEKDDFDISKVGRIDGLVNNAGFHDIAQSNWDKSFTEGMDSMLTRYYQMTQNLLPFLKASKGSIVNICTGLGKRDPLNNAKRAAIMGGQKALTREWAVELLKYQIRSNAVILPEEDIDPSEVANIVSFLLSEKSSHTTGQLIQICSKDASSLPVLQTVPEE